MASNPTNLKAPPPATANSAMAMAQATRVVDTNDNKAPRGVAQLPTTDTANASPSFLLGDCVYTDISVGAASNKKPAVAQLPTKTAPTKTTRTPAAAAATLGLNIGDYVFSDDEMESAVAISKSTATATSSPPTPPNYLDDLGQEFSTVLSLVFPNDNNNNHIDLLEYFWDLGVLELGDLTLFVTDSGEDIFLQACMELPCWQDQDEETTMPPEFRRTTFAAICKFIALTSAQEFHQMVYSMMDCNYSIMDIVLALHKRIVEELDLQTAKRLSLSSTGSSTLEEEPPTKKARLSPTSVADEKKDDDDDDGGGKVGAVRDLQQRESPSL